MRWFSSQTRKIGGKARPEGLARDEKGAVAAFMAVLISALVGMAGTAVDVGILLSTRSELQNAADAAALAGANTMLDWSSGETADVTAEVALQTAQSISLANEALKVNLQLPAQDVTMGFWDPETDDFDPARTGVSANPDDMTGFRVLLRRDNTANGPVPSFFAGAVGIDEFEVTAQSTALLGWAAKAGEGEVDLPIAVKSDALTGEDGEPNCGEYLEFHSENDENAEWTTFFTWPTNDPNVDRFVTGEVPVPPLEVGDEINVINGNLSNHTFGDLMDRFGAEGEDTNGDGEVDYWLVTLPVITPDLNATSAFVDGFAHMVITGVYDAPYKHITGYLQCGLNIPDSPTGGGNYGTRATVSRLVN